jgi:hypothetical protein
MTTYRSATVWDTEPNAIADPRESFRRSLQKLDPETGKITVIDRSGVTTLEIDTLAYLFEQRTEVLAFRSFLASCKGRLVGFWLPTWQADFRLYAPASAGGTVLQIKACGYSRFSFWNLSRRDIAIMMLDHSAKYFHRIVDATWDGGPFESLTLETPLEANLTDAAVLISFLTFARLAADDAGECVWETTEVARGVLSFVSLPMEVPS